MIPMWIGGEDVDAHAKEVFDVENPATEEILDRVPRARETDVDRAVTVASSAFEAWWRLPGLDRADKLHEIARRLREQKEPIARQMTLEGGKIRPGSPL